MRVTEPRILPRDQKRALTRAYRQQVRDAEQDRRNAADLFKKVVADVAAINGDPEQVALAKTAIAGRRNIRKLGIVFRNPLRVRDRQYKTKLYNHYTGATLEVVRGAGSAPETLRLTLRGACLPYNLEQSSMSQVEWLSLRTAKSLASLLEELRDLLAGRDDRKITFTGLG